MRPKSKNGRVVVSGQAQLLVMQYLATALRFGRLNDEHAFIAYGGLGVNEECPLNSNRFFGKKPRSKEKRKLPYRYATPAPRRIHNVETTSDLTTHNIQSQN